MFQENAFKAEFKKYCRTENFLGKQLDNCYDALDESRFDVMHHMPTFEGHDVVMKSFICSEKPWSVLSLSKHPGFYLIKNPFTYTSHFYYAYKALSEYSGFPYYASYNDHGYLAPNGEVLCGNIWELMQKCHDKELSLARMYLRMAQQGYYYDYSKHVYDYSWYEVLSLELYDVARYFVSQLSISKNFQPDSALINYYVGSSRHTENRGSRLLPHADVFERDLSEPLLTLSFGQPAIFLVGGKDKRVRPSAFILRSGDICILSGQSREAFHSIPLVTSEIKNSVDFDTWHSEDSLATVLNEPLNPHDSNVESIAKYLKDFRINISTRKAK